MTLVIPSLSIPPRLSVSASQTYTEATSQLSVFQPQIGSREALIGVARVVDPVGSQAIDLEYRARNPVGETAPCVRVERQFLVESGNVLGTIPSCLHLFPDLASQNG